MNRKPPFERSLDIDQVSLDKLVAIAGAIEHESVRRYAALAEAMALRGEVSTAAAFRAMLAEERSHVDAVARWAASLGQPLPSAGTHQPALPAELWKGWDEVAGSARLSPYRAFAIAADTEQKTFALYSYLAAYASDARAREQAEKLALEELGHAAVMRRWRRQAWHREHRVMLEQSPVVVSAESLYALLAQREAEIRARHGGIAAQLRTLGDEESARLLAQLDETPSWPAAAQPAVGPSGVPDDGDVVHLLVSAQEALEAFSETLEDALATTEGELFAEVAKALSNVVERLSRLSLHTARRIQSAPLPGGGTNNSLTTA